MCDGTMCPCNLEPKTEVRYPISWRAVYVTGAGIVFAAMAAFVVYVLYVALMLIITGIQILTGGIN
jgi:hypothetical protein